MKNKKIKLLILIFIAIYTSLMIYFMFFGFGRITYKEHLYNFIPFKSIRESFEIYMFYVKNYSEIAGNEFWHFAVNIFGNIGMFIPYGILLTIFFNFRFANAFGVFEIGILTIETAQLISRRGVFDVDDIILNTIGFLIGYAITMAIFKFIQKKNREDKQIDKIQSIC